MCQSIQCNNCSRKAREKEIDLYEMRKLKLQNFTKMAVLLHGHTYNSADESHVYLEVATVCLNSLVQIYFNETEDLNVII